MNTDTMQEVFNKVWKLIIEQGKPSLNDKGDCKYRGPGGLKCSIGHLIPDDDYSPSMENQIPIDSNHSADIRIFCMKHGYDDLKFMRLLQTCHDAAGLCCQSGGLGFLKEFKKQMRQLAKQYKLKVPRK